jgi:UDP-N-acetylglucosamine/UDP-N-acetyl-alpha-D-glucosaminouronate 4-epimerase
MKALVTGGAGFIGSSIADALLARGDEVVVLDDLSTGFREWIDPRVRLIVGDVADQDAVAEAVAGCEVVFHQAAHRAVQRSVEHPLDTDRANVGGTLTVLVAARDAGARRVVFASSSSVYGGADVRPTPESAPLVPRSPYAVSKVAGELYGRVAWELFGVETVALRYFNAYGPRQRPDSRYAAVIPLFIDALRSGVAPTIHGDGHQSRDFTYIDDVVRANLAAAAAPAEACAGRAYNIAGGRASSLLELLEILQGLLGVRIEPVHTEPRAGDVRHTQASIEAARRDLGHEPEVDFDEGLARTVAWFAGRSASVERSADLAASPAGRA